MFKLNNIVYYLWHIVSFPFFLLLEWTLANEINQPQYAKECSENLVVTLSIICLCVYPLFVFFSSLMFLGPVVGVSYLASYLITLYLSMLSYSRFRRLR